MAVPTELNDPDQIERWLDTNPDNNQVVEAVIQVIETREQFERQREEFSRPLSDLVAYLQDRLGVDETQDPLEILGISEPF